MNDNLSPHLGTADGTGPDDPERARWTLPVNGTELAWGLTWHDGTFLLLAGSHISLRACASNRDIGAVVALRGQLNFEVSAASGSDWVTLDADTLFTDARAAATVVLGTPARASRWTPVPGFTDAAEPESW